MYYAFEGYFDKRQEEEGWFRQLANIVYRSLSTKPYPIEKIWPMQSDKKIEVKEIEPMTKERYEAIKNRYKRHK